MKNTLLLSLAFLVAGSAPLAAQEITLKVGDPAPALDVEHWIKGKAVTTFEPGQAYVVEFWATWCPPCKDSMPHLTKLQEELGDQIVIIGLSDQSLDIAKGFLDKPEWAEKTKYTLGTDPDRSVYAAYMDAAGQKGIPTSFLVNGQGKIAWIGHPAGMDRPLKKMLGMEVGEEDADAMEMGMDVSALLEQEFESTEAAVAWLKKADGVLQQALTSWDFSMSLSIMAGMGPGEMQKLTIKREGTVLQGGDLGKRIDSTNIMDFPGMPEPMKQEAHVALVDGVFYVDRDAQMPMAPKERGKITEENAAALQDEMSGPMRSPTSSALFDPNPMFADPSATLREIVAMCSLDVAEETETQITLRGEGSMMLDMSAMMPGGGGEKTTGVPVSLVLDRATGRPLHLVVGDASAPSYELKFSGFLQHEELEAITFQLGEAGFAWPDLGEVIRKQMEMMQQMQGGPDGPGGDEFENEF